MKFFTFIFLSLSLLNNQVENSLELVKDGQTFHIPVYIREGLLYFSLIHFAESLSLPYKVDGKNNKIEIDFDDFSFYFKAQNPFVVSKNYKTKKTKVIQLPTTTYFIKSNLYVPLDYVYAIFESISNLKFTKHGNNKLVVSSIKNFESAETSKSLFKPWITGLSIEEKANGTLVKIKSMKEIKTYNSSFNEGVLTVTFRDVNLDETKFDVEKSSGLITNIKAKNIGSDCEIKFFVNADYSSSEILNSPGSNDILIALHNKVFANENEKTAKSERWNFDVVVVDAGHGGRDFGAIGINGTREKDVNLAIALKLGKLIEKEMKDIKVVYTRKDDSFVELYKRGKIANDNNGKLFISIHCNSTAKKNSDASGFEVYLLRPGKTQDAIEIAETENAVIKYESDPKRYQKLTDENFILVSMAHSSYMKYSEKFAELLHNQFSIDFNIESRGVKQAGFYVLVGASMPSVLIESGFLSNKHDADFLKSEKGQKEIAASIFSAIKGYKTYYEKVMETEL